MILSLICNEKDCGMGNTKRTKNVPDRKETDRRNRKLKMEKKA